MSKINNINRVGKINRSDSLNLSPAYPPIPPIDSTEERNLKIQVREPIPKQKKTFSITLLGQSVEQLEWLQKRIGTGKQNEVFANSLRLLETLIKEYESGASFYVKRAGKEFEKFDLFEKS